MQLAGGLEEAGGETRLSVRIDSTTNRGGHGDRLDLHLAVSAVARAAGG